MTAFNLQNLTRGQLREALSDAVKKLAFVKETVKNIPEAYIPFPRLQEISFLEQRVSEYRAEITRRRSRNSPARIFYSYSRTDERFMAELNERLSKMRDEGLVETFWDRHIGPGLDWHSEITEELKDADVVLFLVSSHFLKSDYCRQVELPVTLEMHDCDLVRAIPIIIHPCEWQGTALGRLQALPRNGRPLTECPDKDDAWSEIVRGIQVAVEQVR
jgi:hypothetical protein